MSIPTREHIELYQRGIERVIKADHYAGLLVSMHCLGLYDRTRATMPGFSAKYVKSQEAPMVNDFLQSLRLQQLRLKVDLRADPKMRDFTEEKWLQWDALRLEALDRLSLYFCMGALEGATIDAVPANYKGTEVDWDLQPEGSNAATLEPYPFRRDPLEISILARRILKRRYADDADLQKTVALSPYFALKYTLRAGGARTRADPVRLVRLIGGHVFPGAARPAKPPRERLPPAEKTPEEIRSVTRSHPPRKAQPQINRGPSCN